jgi:polyisoprenoid-binding protein YceI
MAQAAPTRTIRGIQAPIPGTWEIDPSHTNIGFVARYLMVTKVRGHFTKFSGAIHVAERPQDSWAELAIDAASIDTNQPDRDNHLRSPDFLDVEHYPTITYKATKLELTGANTLKVTGDLTVRDVTRPVVLDVEFEGVTKDAYGKSRVAFSATSEIDRTEFGASWNMVLETGGFLVSKEIKLELDVLATLTEVQVP